MVNSKDKNNPKSLDLSYKRDLEFKHFGIVLEGKTHLKAELYWTNLNIL